jgi:hypothetical protein
MKSLLGMNSSVRYRDGRTKSLDIPVGEGNTNQWSPHALLLICDFHIYS